MNFVIFNNQGGALVAYARIIFQNVEGRTHLAAFLANTQQLTEALFKYINGFYNMRRRHSSIGGISPAQFERNTA